MSSRQSSDFEEHIRLSSDEEDEIDNTPFFGEDPNEDVDNYGMRVGTDIIVRNDGPENRQLVQYNAEYKNLLRSAEQIARNRIATNTRNQYNKANCNTLFIGFSTTTK